MQVQKDTVSSSAEKDITIMRLQSDVKQAQEKLEELQREVFTMSTLRNHTIVTLFQQSTAVAIPMKRPYTWTCTFHRF